MKVKPFTINAVKNNKCFYRLNTIKNVDEIEISHYLEDANKQLFSMEAFIMNDSSIVLSWSNHLNLFKYYNYIVTSGNKKEIVNLSCLERIINIVDSTTNDEAGIFLFTKSKVVEESNFDWRCDNKIYGPHRFCEPTKILQDVSDIIDYEPILSINGIGYLVYIQIKNYEQVEYLFLNNDIRPAAGRTLGETLKLIREWSLVHEPPFNNTEDISEAANNLLTRFMFSNEELEIIDSLEQMQVANFVLGKNNARSRPNNIPNTPISVKKMIFDRVSSCSLSALEFLNPGMWDLNELLENETVELEKDIESFNLLKKRLGNIPAIHIQDNIFKNKKTILKNISNNTLFG